MNIFITSISICIQSNLAKTWSFQNLKCNKTYLAILKGNSHRLPHERYACRCCLILLKHTLSSNFIFDIMPKLKAKNKTLYTMSHYDYTMYTENILFTMRVMTSSWLLIISVEIWRGENRKRYLEYFTTTLLILVHYSDGFHNNFL